MLNKRIHRLRTGMAMSQVELANRLCVSKQTVSNWENDNIQPSVDMLVRLAKIFGVTTDYLLGLDDLPRLNVEGLPPSLIAHLNLLIEDFRNREN